MWLLFAGFYQCKICYLSAALNMFLSRAPFPDELPHSLIKMFSFPGEFVLDPFAGSGTTAKVAADLSRKSISVEINPEFIPIIEDQLPFLEISC